MTTTTTTASTPPAEVWLRYSPGWRTLAVSDGWREHTGLPAVFAVRGPVLGYVHSPATPRSSSAPSRGSPSWCASASTETRNGASPSRFGAGAPPMAT